MNVIESKTFAQRIHTNFRMIISKKVLCVCMSVLVKNNILGNTNKKLILISEKFFTKMFLNSFIGQQLKFLEQIIYLWPTV